MKLQLLALFLIFSPISAHPQTIKASDVERLCTSQAEPERLSCSLIVKVYMDGFLEGVAKGVLDTYKYDPQVLALVKDIKMKEAAPRFSKVVDAATCIQHASVADMTATYVEYVRSNPASRHEHYRKAMTRAIVSKYCGK